VPNGFRRLGAIKTHQDDWPRKTILSNYYINYYLSLPNGDAPAENSAIILIIINKIIVLGCVTFFDSNPG
jgi:hypothetical protein